MLTELLLLFSLSAIPASFSFFLDFCLGKPGHESAVNTRAIFFGYTYFLSRRRAVKMDLYTEIYHGFYEGLQSPKKAMRKDVEETLQLSLLLAARKYFTWEMALGMCVFCTNFWVSEIAAGFFFRFLALQHFSPFLLFLFIPLFSHSILRKF